MPTVAELNLPTQTPWRKILPKPLLTDRDTFLLELARGKTVLHVGAADSPLTRERYETGELLHMKLRPVVKEMVGVDIDADAAAFLRDKTGIDDIVIADVIENDGFDRDERLKKPFDLIYCCDIIEHVSNPGSLLANLATFCHKDTRIVLTTPNALSIKAALRPLLLGIEFIHPDHVSYFSFATLAELMRRNNIEPVGYSVFAYQTPSWVAKTFFNTLYKISPNSAEGIIMIGRSNRAGNMQGG